MNKIKGMSSSVKKLFKYLKVEKLAIVIACIFAILSVSSMIILPQELGDTTDIIISGLMQKSTYKEVNDAYTRVYKALEEIDEIKSMVKDINNLTGEERQIYDALLHRDYSIGHLKNEARLEGSSFKQEDKDRILALPEECNNIRLRAVLGYYFDGAQMYEPLDTIDCTFGEYIEIIEIDIDFSKYMPKQMEEYFYNMEINNPEGYSIINEYNSSKNVGEFLKKTKLEEAFSIPNAYKDLIYSVGLQEKPDIDWQALSEKIILLAILAFIYSVFAYLQGFVLSGVAQRVAHTLRYEVNKKLFMMPMNQFDKKMKGDIMSVISNDIDSISTALNQTISQIITTIAMMIGVLVMMIRISPILSLVAIICIPVSILLMKLIVKLSQKHFDQMQQALANVNANVEESFRGHDVIQIFNKQKEHEEIFEQENNKLAKAAHKSQFTSNLMQPISKFIGNLSYVCACVFGGMIVISGTLTIGNLQSFVQYLRQFTQPINQLSTMFNLMQQSVSAADRVFEILAIKDEVDKADKEIEQTIQGDIDFNNISFAYDKKMVIKDFSFNVKKGQKVAIVGKTGAGKTTLMKLLLRFYELNSGCITIDGVDIKSYSRKDLRKHICIVLQDAWLFEGSIRENIKYGKDISDEKMIESAKKAMVDEFISKLEKGYDDYVNSDASNMSHGQKQLITIARALAQDKEILILDEATSSVDTKTEKALQEAMDNLIKDKTSFIIAHRLSTIKNADVILVVDDGNIIESGTHKLLMNKKGHYYNLYKSQFKC